MPRTRTLPRRLRRLAMAAQNALEIARVGRLGARYSADYEVVYRDSTYRLRRYTRSNAHQGAVLADQALSNPRIAAPLLLIPPLMVTSEIYDIDEQNSAVAALTRGGVDVWVVDFGAPEREEGGMSRTLDDHVRAVSDAVARARARTSNDVHLAGYSQGGMFAYQAAALRRGEGVASVITFGSPVNIHRNLPAVRDSFAEKMIGALRSIIAIPLESLEGLPGRFTSTGFKVMSARKELQQFASFLGKLHDRSALESRESKRIFLGGEGFVAWPGPALRTFIDEVIVRNRMASGGMVIDGQTVSLADIHRPILYFVGLRDDIARPASVHAVRRAATESECFGVDLKAGHFGLVIGSTAQTVTWPTVIEWLRWQADEGPKPKVIASADAMTAAAKKSALETQRRAADDEDYDHAFEDIGFDLELFYDVASKATAAAWQRVGDIAQEVSVAVDDLRWQVPRLRKLRNLTPSSRISLARELADRARVRPDGTFFMWRGRAFTYAQANTRVNNIARGLITSGLRPGQRVAVLMSMRPSYLSLVAALSRIGAVAVLLDPGTEDSNTDELRASIAMSRPELLVTDPEHANAGRAAFVGQVMVLGGGPSRSVPSGITDLEAIEPDSLRMPAWYEPDRGRADELAMIIVGVGHSGKARAAHISNRRWAFSAYGAAASCTLTSKDTIYCCLPLHHAAGALVAAGGALAGGSRLALAPSFRPDEFWPEVRRYGATVVFYAGEMCRALVDAPAGNSDIEHHSSVRMFAGSGMRRDVWLRLVERFGPFGVLEFYASTEGNAVLANASGAKIGAVGRAIPGSSQLMLVEYDHRNRSLSRDTSGRCTPVGDGRPGMLITRIDALHPVSDGSSTAQRIVRDVFATGDSWFVTGDLLRRDADGDYWFVDRAADQIATAEGPVAAFAIEDALYQLADVTCAVAFGAPVSGSEDFSPIAAVVMKPGATLEASSLLACVEARLPQNAWPQWVISLPEIPMTEGHRPIKSAVRASISCAQKTPRQAGLRYDSERHAYVGANEITDSEPTLTFHWP